MIKNYVLFIIIACTIIGCNSEVSTGKKGVLDIEQEINNNNFKVCNLSKFGNGIRYIPLETNDESLIGKAKEIFFEDNNIYIRDDQQNLIRRFDLTGKYLGTIGYIGGGPEEYEGQIFSLDVYPLKKQLSFTTNSFNQYIYTFTGDFIKRVKLPKVEEHVSLNSIQLNENIFICDLISIMQTKYNYLIYNDSLSKITYIDQELSPVPKFDDSFSTHDMAITWRYKDKLRYLKYMDHIIYSFQKNAIKDTLYTIQYGKYRIIKPDLLQHEIIKNSINMQFAIETDKYIYLQFDFNKWAPETIQEEIKLPDGTTKMITRTTVCAVYDKSSHSLQLLKHPIENTLGLYNDIDDGPPFWPQYISTAGKMIMCYSSEKLIEIYNRTKNPSAEFTKVIQNINEEANPVIMLVQL